MLGAAYGGELVLPDRDAMSFGGGSGGATVSGEGTIAEGALGSILIEARRSESAGGVGSEVSGFATSWRPLGSANLGL